MTKKTSSVEKIKKGEFIKLDFVGRIKNNNQIFDLTREDIAKKEDIYQKGYKYTPLPICIGAGHLISGLDEFLIGKEIGKEYEIDLPPEKAFGKRNPKLLQIMSLSILKKKNINPFPGLQLNLDNRIATVRSVTGGRVVIDFNLPLAGKDLHYWLKPVEKISDTKEKVEIVFKSLGFAANDINIKNSEVIIKLKNKEKLGQQFLDLLSEQVKKSVPEVKKVTFE